MNASTHPRQRRIFSVPHVHRMLTQHNLISSDGRSAHHWNFVERTQHLLFVQISALWRSFILYRVVETCNSQVQGCTTFCRRRSSVIAISNGRTRHGFKVPRAPQAMAVVFPQVELTLANWRCVRELFDIIRSYLSQLVHISLVHRIVQSCTYQTSYPSQPDDAWWLRRDLFRLRSFIDMCAVVRD